MVSPGLLCPALVGLFGRFLPLWVLHDWVLSFRSHDCYDYNIRGNH